MRFSAACQEQANARTDTTQAYERIMVQASDTHALSRQFKSTGHARADQIGCHRSAVQLDGGLVRATRVELELLVPVVGPAIMPLRWVFIACWFASFGSADQRQPEQRRNRRTLNVSDYAAEWLIRVR
jgi:hypothetical protein